MAALLSHRDVIDLWPTLRDFADDIGVTYNTAKHMRRRNSIPDAHRAAAIDGAVRRELGELSFELLTRLAPSRRGVLAEARAS